MTVKVDSAIEQKRRMLLAKLLERERGASVQQAIKPRTGPGAHPLSSAQQRIWFFQQLEPDNPAYHMPVPLRLDGPLDVAALGRALQQIVRRHAILRTTFATIEGRPMQIVAAWEAAPERRLAVIDLSTLAEPQRAAELRSLIDAEARRPFVLATGPLIRMTLLLLSVTEHVLLLSLHHIVFDGWSLSLFLDELAALYAANRACTPAALPPPAIQYADFACWQEEWKRSEALQQQLEYWKKQLAGAPAALELAADRARPARQTFRAAGHRMQIPRAGYDAIVALSRQAECTPFMVLLAAFTVLLLRYSGQEDLVVGAPIAGRNRTELAGAIGCFVNTLALRADLSGNPTVRALLQRVRKVALGAYAHQDVPFEKLVEALRPERTLSYMPLFQVLFTLHNTPPLNLTPGDLRISLIEAPRDMGWFDLSLTLYETPDGMAVWLEYSLDLFDAATAARMAGHFERIITNMLDDPDQRIEVLPLLSEAERQQMLVEWNATCTPYPHAVGLHALFAEQAARTPDAVAVVFDRPTTNDQRPKIEDGGWRIEDRPPSILHPLSSILYPQCLTYRELDARANQLAHTLRRHGVGPDTLVPLCVERSMEMIVGILGILKAGGAYVPLDSTLPAERLRFMLEDARPAVVLVATNDYGDKETRRQGDDDGSPYARPLSSILHPPSSILDLRAEWPTIAQESATALWLPDLRPDHLAYVMYTSGSTGAPKGVAVTHRNVVRLVRGTTYARFGPDQTFLQLTPIAFDVATFEIWGALLHGARLVLAPPQFPALAELEQLIHHQQVSILWLTAGLFQQLVEIAPHVLRGVRQLLAGGDVVSPTHVHRLREALPEIEVINGYGPTECTTFTCCYAVDAATPLDRAIPIGPPIANARTYILDQHLAPVPVGVAGELYIGGDGLARGYLHRPDLTAERFVPNPFADQRPTTNDQRRQADKQTSRQADKQTGQSPISNLQSPDTLETQNSALRTQNSRLYKTGDLARYLPDGNIDFLGRLDTQVKLRGYRIELDEIAVVLGQHTLVRQALVVMRTDVPGQQQLVAYVVPTNDQRQGDKESEQSAIAEMPSSILHPPSSILAELRAFLKDRLPEYMVPAAFVLLDALPLTPNGKVDRRALPAPDTARPTLASVFAAPQTDIEQTLADIWAEMFKVERVGIHDDFFELGGHSLLALQLIARVRDFFQVDLPLRNVFKATTIATFAMVLEEALIAEVELLTEEQLQQLL